MIMWIMNQWSLIIWMIILLTAVIMAWRLWGVTIAGPLAAGLSILLSFFAGKKIQRDEYRKQVQDIEEKRDEEYEKIDRRNTKPSDAADRLRNGRY